MVEVPGQVDRIPPFDRQRRAHLWTIMVAFRVDPERMTDPTETPMLDGENLLTLQGPGCFYCEAAYTPVLAGRRCTGDPT
jgi:hypothetical protein